VRRVAADAGGIAAAAAAIGSGLVVAIPTDTLYGLAADPFREDAVARLFAAKGRPGDRAIPLIAADVEQVRIRLGELPPAGRRLADAFWPGPLTLLLDAPDSLAPEVTAGTGRIGVRVPAHATARALCRACGGPLTATSANITDRPPTNDPDEVERTLGSRIEMLLDGGRSAGGPPSTIVDATGDRPRLVRPGAVDWEEVLACVRRP
jgi:L-threonylcarbamoyladenylate synthase